MPRTVKPKILAVHIEKQSEIYKMCDSARNGSKVTKVYEKKIKLVKSL